MRRLFRQRAGFLALSLCLILAAALVPTRAEQEILLCGEVHAQEDCLEQELALWQARYEAGDRDLFLEIGEPTAILLNRWMRTGDESFWQLVYAGWEGTASQEQSVADFYHTLQKLCPETVFHGIDMEHQYRSTGAFCLTLLEKEGRKGTDEYRRAALAMEQAKRFYQGEGDLSLWDNAYREDTLAENFRTAYEALGRRRVMGIFGAAHTDPYGTNYYTDTTPSMAARLKERYGGRVRVRDLRGEDVLQRTTLNIAGAEFEAIYYGDYPITRRDILRSGEFWRLADAYDALSQWERSGDTLPGNEYPMSVRSGEAYAIHYRCWNDTDYWWYGVCDGAREDDGPLTTAEVIPPEEETP